LNVAIVLSIPALWWANLSAPTGLGNLLLQLNFNMDISGMFAVLAVPRAFGNRSLRPRSIPSRPFRVLGQPDNLRSGSN